MMNAIIEFASREPAINQRAELYFAMLRQGFRGSLIAAKRDGSLNIDLDVEDMTEVLLSAALGLNAVIRANSDAAIGQKMAGSIANMVRSWGARPAL
jgi:hypothetical protein